VGSSLAGVAALKEVQTWIKMGCVRRAEDTLARAESATPANEEPTYIVPHARTIHTHPDTEDEDAPEKCEGCDKPATCRDWEGTPLCKDCFDELKQATKDHIPDATKMVTPAPHPDTVRLDWLEQGHRTVIACAQGGFSCWDSDGLECREATVRAAIDAARNGGAK